MIQSPTARPKLTIGFILLDRFTLTPFAAMVDVLRLAADTGDRSRPIACRWEVLSSDLEPVRASCGFKISPTFRLDTAPHFDYLAIMGGLLFDEPRLSEAEADFLRQRAESGTPLIGVCTGAIELVAQGLMQDRPCCVSWFHVADLLDRFPDARPVSDQLYLDDGERITCAGGAGAADLAALLVARHCGAHAAQKALRILQIDHLAERANPQPTPSLAPKSRSERVRRALLIMEETFAAPISIDAIANRLSISCRQLERDFQTEFDEGPNGIYLRLRLDHGRKLLARGDASITSIALACGFSDASHFAKRFHVQFGESPSNFRRALRTKGVMPSADY